MTAYLDMGQLVSAARFALRAEPELVSRHALLRCVAEPAAVAGSVEVYPELADKAAALLVAVARTHRPFADGNKRAGFVAATLMVNLNGHRLVMPLPVASALIGRVAEPQDVAAVLAAHIVRRSRGESFSDAQIDALADEAEGGYAVDEVLKRRRAAVAHRSAPLPPA